MAEKLIADLIQRLKRLTKAEWQYVSETQSVTLIVGISTVGGGSRQFFYTHPVRFRFFDADPDGYARRVAEEGKESIMKSWMSDYEIGLPASRQSANAWIDT